MKRHSRRRSRTNTGESTPARKPERPRRSSTPTQRSRASRALKGPPAANPYVGVPGGGITYPPYYRPTAYLTNNNNYFAGTETLGEDEMRISFLGSTPFPVTKTQAGTCIMVELGNGKKFFFDFGSGCMRNVVAMQCAVQTVNDIFFTHLHVDHYADLPYLFAFAPWMGRWKPLRVHGPSGRTPKDGIKHMIHHMREMTWWHRDSFNAFPIGDGYEVEVNEFDYKDDNGICYDQDGVTVRHWRRSHTKDGASAYRLDWNGLSFVWTGDGKPDERTIKYARGVDVFVTEVQPDLGNLTTLKFGTPAIMTNVTIDGAHSPHYALGYLLNQVQPRLGMCTHFTYDEQEVPEIMAGIRNHYKGLFQFGAPDVVVVNVTKDAIWTRKAAFPESAMPSRPKPAEAMALFDISPTQTKIKFPKPVHYLEDLVSKDTIKAQIDPRLYYPKDVSRPVTPNFPREFSIDVKQMVEAKLKRKLENKAKLMAERITGEAGSGERRKIAQKIGKALADAQSPLDLLAIVKEHSEHLNQPEVLAEVLGKARKIGALLKKLQALGRMLTGAAGSR